MLLKNIISLLNMDVLINPTAESYGVDADTLREWLNGLPASIFEKEIPVPTSELLGN